MTCWPGIQNYTSAKTLADFLCLPDPLPHGHLGHQTLHSSPLQAAFRDAHVFTTEPSRWLPSDRVVDLDALSLHFHLPSYQCLLGSYYRVHLYQRKVLLQGKYDSKYGYRCHHLGSSAPHGVAASHIHGSKDRFDVYLHARWSVSSNSPNCRPKNLLNVTRVYSSIIVVSAIRFAAVARISEDFTCKHPYMLDSPDVRLNPRYP